MSAFDIVAWIVHALLIGWSWPWPWLRDKRLVGPVKLGLLCALPILTWPVLCWRGHTSRRDLRSDRREVARADAVAFLRGQLVSGTPVEQDNARQLLAMWGEPEKLPEAQAAAPIIVRTSEPEKMRTMSVDGQQWLVVGGDARPHVEPSSHALYAAGCRCSGCRKLNGIELAMRSVHAQIRANLSVPPEILGPPGECTRCEYEIVQQFNSAGQVCVSRRYVTHECQSCREAREASEYWNAW